MRVTTVFAAAALLAFLQTHDTFGREAAARKGSVVFIHPDGSGASMWMALRLIERGPDGMLAWDSLERAALYRGHLADSPVSSSNGGATAHAYGIKARYDDYGIPQDDPRTSLSGLRRSIMMEARDAGLAVAAINSGHMAEPGTGVFLSSAASRKHTDTITAQIVHSGADVMLSGGETLLLPTGTVGRFGKEGVRADGRNLIEEARAKGYRVVYDRAELLALPDTVSRVLGVFAAGHTFNDLAEENLKAQGLPLYSPEAPSVADMTAKTLAMFSARGKRFLMVVEEEGSDNFANVNNAAGAIEALRRADAAISAAMSHARAHGGVTILTAADSDAGGIAIVRAKRGPDEPLPALTDNGAPLDGTEGTSSAPFVSAPDSRGVRHAFGIGWAALEDLDGPVVARAHGLNACRLDASVQNTGIYRLMYLTLFGTWLP